jgi:pimeloyl-ACP methyl ester carboxylesterase
MRQLRLCTLLLAAPLTAQTHQLVDIGPYSLDVLRAGSGGPVVVLEAGLGDSLTDWDTVWPGVARFTTVIAYSRISAGLSGGPPDYSARRAVTDLHTLLARLGIRPPVVLVGRSYGGLLVRLYTSLYASDVAGLVLVDGTHEQQVRRWGVLDSTYPGAFRSFFDSLAKTLPPGAQRGEELETMRIQEAGTLEGLTPVPDIPMAVLTSMRVDPAPKTVNQTARGHELWRDMHEEWSRRSHNAVHIVTTRSGHAIQRDEPQLVVDAIRFVWERTQP